MRDIREKRDIQVALKSAALREESGRMRLVHHGTRANFSASDFAPLSHFGTRSAVSDRLYMKGDGLLRDTLRLASRMECYWAGEDHGAEIERLTQLARDEYPSHPGWEDFPEDSEDRIQALREMLDARIISAFLDIQNPLTLPDVNDTHDRHYLAELIEAAAPGTIDASWDELQEMEAGEMEEFIIASLIEAGYDGLHYVNKHEDPGSDSWMILDAAQVHVQADQDYSASRDAWTLSLESFTGPEQVSPIYSIDGRDEEYETYMMLWEALEDASLPVLDRFDGGWEVRWLHDWEPAGTVGLVDPAGNARGFYMDGQLWLDEDVRGQGRSTPMIAATADLLGGCPTSNVDGLGFSEEGYGAHASAWRKICEDAADRGYETRLLAEDPEEPEFT